VANSIQSLFKSRLLDVNWGTSSQAMNLQDALTSIQQLVHIEEHVKNYQPQILALTGPPRSRPALVDFAYLICKKNSMLVCGNVVQVNDHIIPY
jgi:solute carrier family 12 sodium/potassium/chloride transporter 2